MRKDATSAAAISRVLFTHPVSPHCLRSHQIHITQFVCSSPLPTPLSSQPLQCNVCTVGSTLHSTRSYYPANPLESTPPFSLPASHLHVCCGKGWMLLQCLYGAKLEDYIVRVSCLAGGSWADLVCILGGDRVGEGAIILTSVYETAVLGNWG